MSNVNDPPGYITRSYRLPEQMVKDIEAAAHQQAIGKEALVQLALAEWLMDNLRDDK